MTQRWMPWMAPPMTPRVAQPVRGKPSPSALGSDGVNGLVAARKSPVDRLEGLDAADHNKAYSSLKDLYFSMIDI
jgi:hypothetical protein